jgi:hypothetical protein
MVAGRHLEETTMYRRNYYQDDPRWIDIRYAAKCPCGQEIRRGDRGFYYPKGKTLVCENCGFVGESQLRDDDSNAMLKVQ